MFGMNDSKSVNTPLDAPFILKAFMSHCKNEYFADMAKCCMLIQLVL